MRKSLIVVVMKSLGDLHGTDGQRLEDFFILTRRSGELSDHTLDLGDWNKSILGLIDVPNEIVHLVSLHAGTSEEQMLQASDVDFLILLLLGRHVLLGLGAD